MYCDSRSECYQIEDFDREVLVKANAVELLRKELARKRVKGTIGTGAMNDPYMPLEAEVNLTGRALEVIAEFRFPVHILTKSDLVLRDLDTLCKINQTFAAVSFTITTADDDLAKKLELGASLVSDRLEAMRVLAAHGIYAGVTMMPILPFIVDNRENIAEIIAAAREHGASYIVPSFGMTLRDRQRAYYYSRLDRLFPGLRSRYERRFGNQYHCAADGARQLAEEFDVLCARHGLATRMDRHLPEAGTQLGLF